jgi:hypothetical protein
MLTFLQSTTRTSFTGGGALKDGQVYTKQDKVETTATVWSPCGTTGILNINNRVSLTSKRNTAFTHVNDVRFAGAKLFVLDKKSDQTGELSNDDATVAFTQQLHVSWRTCTPT